MRLLAICRMFGAVEKVKLLLAGFEKVFNSTSIGL